MNFKQLMEAEDGTVSIEYALLLAVFVAALILVLIALGGWLSGKWTDFQTEVGA